MQQRWILAATTFALAVAAAAWAAPFNETVSRSPQQQAHHEIAILNLLNGLDMDAKQQRALLTVAEKAKAAREDFRAQEAALQPATQSAYMALEKELLLGRPAAPPTEKAAQEARDRERQLELQYEQKMRGLVEEAKGVMSPGQLDIIRHYSICLIPPKDLRDPSRVGQANDGSHIEKALSRIHHAGPRVQAIAIAKYLDRHLEEFRKVFPQATDDEQRAERGRVRGLIERANRLSDADFALNRAEIADEIVRPFTEFKNALHPKNPWFNVEHLLLDDSAPDLLKKLLANAHGN